MKTIKIILLGFGLIFSGVKTEFSGYSKVRSISVGVNFGDYKKLNETESDGYRCSISEIDGKYFWASRDNKELIKVHSGMYTIYVSTEGVGFIKVINHELKNRPDWEKISMLFTETEKQFDYVEVIHTGLTTLTYHGKQK